MDSMDTSGNMEPTMMRMMTVCLLPRESYAAGGAVPCGDAKGCVRVEVPYSVTMRDLAAELVRATSAPTATMRVREWLGVNAHRNAEDDAARVSAVHMYVVDCSASESDESGESGELVPVPPVTCVEEVASLARDAHSPDGAELVVYYSQEERFGCCCCGGGGGVDATDGGTKASQPSKPVKPQPKPSHQPTPGDVDYPTESANNKPSKKPATTTTNTNNNNNTNSANHAPSQPASGNSYPSEPTYSNNPTAGDSYEANAYQPPSNTYNTSNYNGTNAYQAESHDPYQAVSHTGADGGDIAPNTYGLPPNASQPPPPPPPQAYQPPQPAYGEVRYGTATSGPLPL